MIMVQYKIIIQGITMNMEVTMKTKKFSKKLALGKQTIANITQRHMQGVRGGRPSIIPICDTVDDFTCHETDLTCATYCDTCGTVCPGSCPKTICA